MVQFDVANRVLLDMKSDKASNLVRRNVIDTKLFFAIG